MLESYMFKIAQFYSYELIVVLGKNQEPIP